MRDQELLNLKKMHEQKGFVIRVCSMSYFQKVYEIQFQNISRLKIVIPIFKNGEIVVIDAEYVNYAIVFGLNNNN